MAKHTKDPASVVVVPLCLESSGGMLVETLAGGQQARRQSPFLVAMDNSPIDCDEK